MDRGTPTTRTPFTGACLCGAVRYSVSAPPLPLSTTVCNCKDCQRSSGSAFSVVVPVRTAALTVEGDALATFNTTGTDSDEVRDRKFCSTCGSQVLSVLAEAPEITWLKAGTLDDTSWVTPTMQVWGESAQPWTKKLIRRPRIKRGPPTAALRLSRPLLKALDRK
ncbi:GFA family protein [Paraconexibacter sp. AEG42_29]